MFPPLVPALDLELHFVLCDFGALGTAYVETVPTEVDRDTIIRNMMSGEYDHPLHVIAVNPAKGWARDVSEDIARALIEPRCGAANHYHPARRDLWKGSLAVSCLRPVRDCGAIMVVAAGEWPHVAPACFRGSPATVPIGFGDIGAKGLLLL